MSLAHSNGSPGAEAFLREFQQSREKSRAVLVRWIEYLRAQGIDAACPDDGWVNHADDTIQPVNCYFRMVNMHVGSRIAIGQPSYWQSATITAIRWSMFNMEYWSFK